MISLKRSQNGLSLIELMIAIGLSMILSLGVIQIFSSSKQTSRVQDSLARLQENARFALDLLAHDIRMAGQLGCDSSVKPTDNTNLLRPFGNGIFGYEYAGLPAELLIGNASNPSSANIIAGTDTIIVMSAAINSIPTKKNTTAAVRAKTPGEFAEIETGDPLLVSDCETAEIFIADKVDDNTINANPNLSKRYRDFSLLSPLNYSAYYIREKDNQKNLYRSLVNHSGVNTGIDTTPLLEGVENMQILYGEDINGDGNSIRYVAANAAGLNMEKVSSIRIHLLLATLEDGLASEPQDYWFNGNNETATDKRLYRSFTTTIKLRNQGTSI